MLVEIELKKDSNKHNSYQNAFSKVIKLIKVVSDEGLIKHEGDNVTVIRNDDLMFDNWLVILPKQLYKNLNRFSLENGLVALSWKDSKHFH